MLLKIYRSYKKGTMNYRFLWNDCLNRDVNLTQSYFLNWLQWFNYWYIFPFLFFSLLWDVPVLYVSIYWFIDSFFCFLQNNTLPPVLFLQADNCWRENKNKYVFAFCELLVRRRVFKQVSALFHVFLCYWLIYMYAIWFFHYYFLWQTSTFGR